ncbi:MAG: gliding motility-associated C-terminal domain-containing protein [Sphingobacteriaceae bacterium]|nr:gliding motility-associated C-terminal domain-containing protein [Sphingobacteriaceae bacterium]
MSRIFTLLYLITCFQVLGSQGPSIAFKENKGQVSDQFSKPRPDVLFTGSAGDLDFHLRKNGISYQLYRVDTWKKENKQMEHLKKGLDKVPDQVTVYRLDMNWVNSNLNAFVLKENAVEGYDNYYNEVCPNGITGVRSYKKVCYKNLYKGIDLKWYEKKGNLKYDYIVAPGIDHKQIQLEIKGAESISISKSGGLIIKTPLGTLEEKAPYVTQDGKVLKAKWIINKNVVSFDIIGVDAAKPLIIDPLVRLWGTYFGGNGRDYIFDITPDLAGDIYFTGETLSQTNLATVGAHQTVYGGGNAVNWGDAFLSKFTSTGARVWTTYYGGSEVDAAYGCDVDVSGNRIVMVGVTESTLSGVIATAGAYQTINAGTGSQWWGDGFVAMFDANGLRQWGTYYGGPNGDWLGEVCFDKATNDIYVCGSTESTVGIASSGAHQSNYNGGYDDAFVVKFNSGGTTRIWATYYGGSDHDYFNSCKTDNNGNVYLTGASSSTNNISTPGSHQSFFAGGSPTATYGDGIFVKLNSSGVRQWGTYYGDVSDDWIYNCVINSSGDIYFAGTTTSSLTANTIATPGAHQSTYGGGSNDAFLAKFDAAGVRQWCTFYGGSGIENNNYCGIDPSGNIYLTGITNSNGTNIIATPCAYQQNLAAGLADVYLAKFEPSGKRLWGTYYGGFGLDDGALCNCDAFGNVYLIGYATASSASVMTSPGAFQTVFMGGGTDAFIAKFDGCIPVAPPNTTNPTLLNICKGDSTFLSINSSFCSISWFDVPQGGIILDNDSLFETPNLNANTTYYVSEGSCGTDTIRTAITVIVNSPTVTLNTSGVVLCHASTVALIASGADYYSWLPESMVSCATCSDPIVSPLQTTEYCVIGTDTNACSSKTCVSIEVDLTGDHNFSLPNAFTPNGDGINDSFCLKGWDACNAEFEILIYDRWGEKVFESSDPDFCWNGVYKGELLSSDVFIYNVVAKYKDDTEVKKKGNITLIR